MNPRNRQTGKWRFCLDREFARSLRFYRQRRCAIDMFPTKDDESLGTSRSLLFFNFFEF
jgi:hypothetical protein